MDFPDKDPASAYIRPRFIIGLLPGENPGGESAHVLYHKNSGIKLRASVGVVGTDKSPSTRASKMNPSWSNLTDLENTELIFSTSMLRADFVFVVYA